MDDPLHLSDEDKIGLYATALRALIERHGGHLKIEASEIAEEPFSIFWKLEADGSLEFMYRDLSETPKERR